MLCYEWVLCEVALLGGEWVQQRRIEHEDAQRLA
jgi:hypothetical protein